MSASLLGAFSAWGLRRAIGRCRFCLPGALRRGRPRRDLHLFRRDRGPRSHPLDPCDDHAILWVKTLANDAQAFVKPAGLDAPVLHQAFLVEDPDEALRLVEQDGGVRQEDRRALSAAGEQQAGEEPRRKYEIGIRDKSAPDHRSGALVELVVHEIHVAFMQKLSFVRQSETYRVLVLARARTFAALRKTGVFEIGA